MTRPVDPTPTAPRVVITPPVVGHRVAPDGGDPDRAVPRRAVRVDWGRNGLLLLMVGVLVMAAGMIARRADAVALGLALDLLVAGSAWVAVRSLRAVRVQREYPTRVLDREPVTVRWHLDSRSAWPLLFAAWEDSCLLQKGPKPTGAIPGLVRRGAPAEVAYTLACERGRGAFDVGPGWLESSDPLGLFRVRREIPQALEPIRVYPRPLDLGALPFAGQQPWQRLGRKALHLAGVGLDFSGTREFRAGDSPRHIHWRATARLQQLIVKEFDQTIRPDISVLLDLSREARLGTGEHSTTGYAIRIAGSIAAWALDRGHRAQVVANQGDEIVASTLGIGHDHLLRIFDELAAWRPSGEMPLTELVENCDRARLFSPGSVVVVIAPSRILFLSDVARLFALFDAAQVDVAALALSETDFVPLHAGQKMTEHDLDRARRAAAALLMRGVEVDFIDVNRLAASDRASKSERAPQLYAG